VVFLFVFLGKVYVADIYAGKSVQENIDKKQALTHLASAIKYYPNESKYYSQAGQDFMLLANEEAMKDADQRDVNEIKNDINDSIVQAEKGVNMNSKDVGAVEALAQIHENAGLYDSGYLESALDKYQSASTLEPHNPIFYAKMGQIKLGMAAAEKDQNKKKQLIAEAKNLTSKSLEEKEDLADGYYQLSVAESASGESDQAITDAEKSFSLSAGNNADYNIGLARLYQDRGKENDLKAAEQLYKLVISQNDQNINAHFYLGLLHEKQKNKDDAKNEYKRVADLMTDGKNSETKKQIEKMISNIDSGVENSPESLGLVSSEENNSTAASTTTEQ
jgi:cytochrome c-type biogenesis protein CcmH/NrfG